MSEVLAILVPVLGRPHRVAPLLDSIAAATPEPHSVHFVCDPHDLAEIGAIREDGRAASIGMVAGNYATKINHAVRETTEPLIFLGADDLHFHPGWLAAAAQRLSTQIGVVGTRDLCSRRVEAGEHSTHSLVARWYAELGAIDDPAILLHEGYPHEFVDDEFIETAKSRGAYAHAHDSVVEHLHPMAGKAPMDELYAAQPVRMRQGRRIYNRRRALWT